MYSIVSSAAGLIPISMGKSKEAQREVSSLLDLRKLEVAEIRRAEVCEIMSRFYSTHIMFTEFLYRSQHSLLFFCINTPFTIVNQVHKRCQNHHSKTAYILKALPSLLKLTRKKVIFESPF